MQSDLQWRDPKGSLPTAKVVARPPPAACILQLTPPSDEDCREMLDVWDCALLGGSALGEAAWSRDCLDLAWDLVITILKRVNVYKRKCIKSIQKEILTPPEVATTKGLTQGISSHTQAESSIYSLKSIVRGTYLTIPIYVATNEGRQIQVKIKREGYKKRKNKYLPNRTSTRTNTKHRCQSKNDAEEELRWKWSICVHQSDDVLVL